jgi:putative ABC transport system permease protein
MEVFPILSALRRNRVGAILIAVQIALTLAIVCNSLSIIDSRISRMHRPSGVDEANIFTMWNVWVGKPADVASRIAADMALLRSIPGVIDASPSNSFPLRGGGWTEGIQMQPNQREATVSTAFYFADDHMQTALGLRLVAGRWFTPQEIIPVDPSSEPIPGQLVITRALANALFPAGDALGKRVYLRDTGSSQIIGIVDRAQTPWPTESFSLHYVEYSTFAPFIFADRAPYYIIRTQPGRQADVMRSAQQRLQQLDRNRLLLKVMTFSESRAKTYRSDRALEMILGTVCGLLLIVTALGIVGLTSYWVAQRRRQIGVRRALGARRIDIVRYFQIENLLMAGTGAACGIALGLVLNVWLVMYLDMIRMSWSYLAVAAVVVLALSQAAALWPASRAAALPPALATRNV